MIAAGCVDPDRPPKDSALGRGVEAGPLVVPSMYPPALRLTDDVLDLPLGDEGIEEGLDHLLVGVGQMLDGLELAEGIPGTQY